MTLDDIIKRATRAYERSGQSCRLVLLDGAAYDELEAEALSHASVWAKSQLEDLSPGYFDIATPVGVVRVERI